MSGVIVTGPPKADPKDVEALAGYGVATWLPTLMRGEDYELGSALTFVVLFNLGGIAGMLVAGRASDRFGAPRISAIWFALTTAGVLLLGVRMPLALTFTVVFLTGVFLNSAQTMVYATVSIRSVPTHRATAVGWTSGMGRFGAVFGPWLGGQLLAAGRGDWGFTAFALAGASSTVLIGVAAPREAAGRRHGGAEADRNRPLSGRCPASRPGRACAPDGRRAGTGTGTRRMPRGTGRPRASGGCPARPGTRGRRCAGDGPGGPRAAAGGATSSPRGGPPPSRRHGGEGRTEPRSWHGLRLSAPGGTARRPSGRRRCCARRRRQRPAAPPAD
ncbi:hypothetical protein SUDANB6_00539 [Streptomyces sp. enrichment culture]|uniref:MFS transporter n=1 Tax=Streptomyces sp. enrichment culture TaxID=1795815 RepID=UPI003F5466BC